MKNWYDEQCHAVSGAVDQFAWWRHLNRKFINLSGLDVVREWLRASLAVPVPEIILGFFDTPAYFVAFRAYPKLIETLNYSYSDIRINTNSGL
ncbi:hypothetical protein Sjap_008493 [Stephania japonica]|uniref:Uncharacterized protein n=1 Tax=Stephania japonica TaxID=461633 RepID=A0AAP0JQ96_9MAGN